MPLAVIARNRVASVPLLNTGIAYSLPASSEVVSTDGVVVNRKSGSQVRSSVSDLLLENIAMPPEFREPL